MFHQPSKPPIKRFLSRRQFLKRAAAGVASAGPFLRAAGRAAPNERVRLAFIGCGGRARQMMPMFGSFADVDIVAVSDVLEPRMAQAVEVLSRCLYPQNPSLAVEHERLLERKDVDAVVLATTQHWHGRPHIQACQARKHVFVEKPLSHTVAEGRQMVTAAKKHGVVALMGTQQRAGPHYQKAVELVRSGRLGRVPLVECWNYHNTGPRVGRQADSPAPAGYHWDRWLGPAPWVPFNVGRLNHSWWFDYAGGMMTNWAIHHIDIILWAMQAWSPTAVTCVGGKFVVEDMADTPDTIEASWEFPGWVMQYHYRGFNNFHSVQNRPHHHGLCFHGNKATLVIDRFGYDLWEDTRSKEVAEKATGIPYFDPKDPKRSQQDGPWQRLFIDCIKEGKQPPLELEDSHKATVCCHLANIAYLVRRRIPWDPAGETIPGDAEAAQLLSRPCRRGYELPPV
jgi:predicted dehydrogenase